MLYLYIGVVLAVLAVVEWVLTGREGDHSNLMMACAVFLIIILCPLFLVAKFFWLVRKT